MSASLIPPAWQNDLRKAAKILERGGCKEIFLFGSVADGKAKSASDLDLAVSGCPPGKFFQLLGELMLKLDHPVDLVNLDGQVELADFLKRTERLVKIA